ncbi:unnamed protein product, partial [Mesorhabditis spiculigera]
MHSTSPTPSTSSISSFISTGTLESPTDFSPVKSGSPTVELSCRVCGSVPAIHVYGSYCCGGCKIFFLRCAVGGKPLMCTKGGRCEEASEGGLKKCRACRYQKCIRVGLLPNIPGQRAQRRKLGEQKPQLVGKVEHVPQPSTPCTPARSPQNFCLEPNYKAMAMTLAEVSWRDLRFIAIFRSCGTNADELMQNWKLPTKLSQSSFMPRCCGRAVAHLVDWLKATPEVWALDDQDRVYFCSRLFPMLFPLQLFYCTYKLTRDGMLSWQTDFLALYPEFAEVLSPGALNLHALVMRINALGFSQASAEVVRKARVKYEAILVQLIRDRVPDDTTALRYMSDLLTLRQTLCSGMLKETPYYTRATVLKHLFSPQDGQISPEIFLASLST